MTPEYMDHLMKETTDIRLQPRNFNMDGGFNLSWSWYQVTNNVKHTQIHQSRDKTTPGKPMTLPTSPSTGLCSVSIMGYVLAYRWKSFDPMSWAMTLSRETGTETKDDCAGEGQQ
jgi:hypothetical protein